MAALIGVNRASFRPLAGFWFLNWLEKTGKAEAEDRFRPLAGFWFLNPQINPLTGAPM